MLLYLAATHCRGCYSLAELGQALGPISLAAVNQARAKRVRRMASDLELKRRMDEIAAQLSRGL